MCRGPWGGRCILRSRDAVPEEQASGMRLSTEEEMDTQMQTHPCCGRSSVKANKAPLKMETHFRAIRF